MKSGRNYYGLIPFRDISRGGYYAKIVDGIVQQEIIYATDDDVNDSFVPLRDLSPPLQDYEKYGGFVISIDDQDGSANLISEVLPMTEEEIRAMQESNEEQSG